MIHFQKLDKALLRLQESVSQDPANDLERDGCIYRFKLTHDLLYNATSDLLEVRGLLAVAPKDVVRELANIGWITNPEELIGFIKMRNETIHSYKEEVAQKVYVASKQFAVKCDELIKVLKEKSK